MNKFALPIFIIIIGLLCGYFLTVIFSGNTSSKTNSSPNSSIQNSQLSGNKGLMVGASATPTNLKYSKAVDFKNAEHSTVEITYHNDSTSELTEIQVTIISVGSRRQYAPGSTLT